MATVYNHPTGASAPPATMATEDLPGLSQFLSGLCSITGASGATLRTPEDAVIGQSGQSTTDRPLELPVDAAAIGRLRLSLAFADGHDGERVRAGQREAAIRGLVTSYLDDVAAAMPLAGHRATLSAALEHNECGIVALDVAHRVLFTNAAADAILADRDGIELRRDVPRPTSYHHAVRFQEALDVVMAAPPSRGRPRAMILLLERRLRQRPLIAVLAPVGTGSDHPTGAIVYLMRPERSVDRGLDIICHLHGLSPVETQLVGHLMAGLTVAETAAAMRVKADTARAYLKQVFVKTDTHRQAELLQLMLRYQRAVRGDFAFHPG